MEEITAEVAERMLEKSRTPNVIQAREMLGGLNYTQIMYPTFQDSISII